MKKPPKSRVHVKAQPGGLFDPKRLGANVDGGRETLGIGVKEIAAFIWENRQDPANAWYKRVSPAPSFASHLFNEGELERAVAYVRRIAAEKGVAVPTLWPFVDWERAVRFDRFEEVFGNARGTTAPPTSSKT